MKIFAEDYRSLCAGEEDPVAAAAANYHINDSGFSGIAGSVGIGLPLPVSRPNLDDEAAKGIVAAGKQYYGRQMFNAEFYHAVMA